MSGYLKLPKGIAAAVMGAFLSPSIVGLHLIQIYGLNFKINEVYECGAILLALLAYPSDTADDKKRADLHASLCTLALRDIFPENTADWLQPQHMKPIYAFRKPEQINKDLKTFDRRLRDRMIAGRMVIGFLQEVELGTLPKLPEGVKRLSINEMARLVLDDVGQSDAGNVKTRIWRESLPVIHLAAAMAVTMDGKTGKEPFHALDVALDRVTIETIVKKAERYEDMLAHSRLRLDQERLIKLRLT